MDFDINTAIDTLTKQRDDLKLTVVTIAEIIK